MASSPVPVELLTPEGEANYEAYVTRHRAGLLYYSLRFRDFLVDVLGCDPRYAVARKEGQISGVLPLMAAVGPRGEVLNALPYFGSNGDTLSDDDESRSALDDWYRTASSGLDVAAATIIENPLACRDEVEPPHQMVDTRIGTVTALVGDGDQADAVLGLIDGSARRNINKAHRSGVTVERADDAFAALAALHAEGMSAVGGRVKSSAFFDAVPKHFRAGDDYAVFVGWLDGEVVAALLVFYFGSTVEYYMPASSASHRSAQPMAAVLHAAMADALARGFRHWNWGGSWTSQENLVRFKTKWGGVARPYRYWTTVNRNELLDATPADLLEEYPGFFVAPYSALTSQPAPATPRE